MGRENRELEFTLDFFDEHGSYDRSETVMLGVEVYVYEFAKPTSPEYTMVMQSVKEVIRAKYPMKTGSLVHTKHERGHPILVNYDD